MPESLSSTGSCLTWEVSLFTGKGSRCLKGNEEMQLKECGSEELAHNFTARPCPAFPSITCYDVQTSWQMGPTAAPCLYPGQLHSWRCSSEGHGQQETSQVFPGLFLCQGSTLFLCPEHPSYHQKQTWHPGFLVQETEFTDGGGVQEAWRTSRRPADTSHWLLSRSVLVPMGEAGCLSHRRLQTAIEGCCSNG